jgi:hypothetical protein
MPPSHGRKRHSRIPSCVCAQHGRNWPTRADDSVQLVWIWLKARRVKVQCKDCYCAGDERSWREVATDSFFCSKAATSRNWGWQNRWLELTGGPRVTGRCRYNAQSSAWMTSEIFTTWLKALDELMTNNGRKIVLLVDNARVHNVP